MTESTNTAGDLSQILDANFFSAHWRQRPAVLRGAVDVFLPRRPTRAEVTDAANKVGAVSDGGTIWFIEGVTTGIPGISELCATSMRFFEWRDLWCDAFFTKGSSSIGAHLDNSDNFTLQLEGVKRWCLAAPGGVSDEQRRLRLLGEPNSGSVAEFDPEFEVILQPGDVLYIPLMWRHWGTSQNDSLSISLVLNAHTMWHTASAALTNSLRHHPAWTQPVCVGPGTAQHRALQIQAALETPYQNQSPRQISREAAARMSILRSTKDAPLGIDMTRVREFAGAAPGLPEEDFTIPTSDARTAKTLQALLARKNLKGLLKAAVSRHANCADPIDRARYQSAVDALLCLDDACLEKVLTSPALTSWTAVAKTQLEELPTTRAEDPLAHQLLWVLLPAAAQRNSGSLPDLRVAGTESGRLVAPHFGVAVRNVPTQAHWYVETSREGAVIADDGHGDIPLTGAKVGGWLPRIPDTDIFVLPEPDAWTSRHGLVTADFQSASAEEQFDLSASFAQALSLLREHLPASAAEFQAVIHQVIPIRGRGLTPYNFSVHAFRGLILSTPRPPVMTAQIILHETGHNLMSTLIDLVPLCTNPDTRVISPVVQLERTLPAVFHGAYSFARETHLTYLLLEAGVDPVEGTNMERYLTERAQVVREARDVLFEHADVTPIGSQILDEVSSIVDRVAPGKTIVEPSGS